MSKQILETLMEVLSEEDAKDVMVHRETTIKAPLTERGAKNLVRQFALVDDTSAAVDLMIDKCWRGFKAEWFFNEMSSGARRSGRIGSSGTVHIMDQYRKKIASK
jgi:hypothetical protein